MVLYAKRNQDFLDHRKSKMSSKPKGRISSWPGASNSSAGIEGSTGDDSVGTAGGVVLSVGVEIGDGSVLFERLLKSERIMENNVSFRMPKTVGVTDVCWNSSGEGSVVVVAFALMSLSGSRDCVHFFSI